MGLTYGRGLLANFVFQIPRVLSLLDQQLPPLQHAFFTWKSRSSESTGLMR